MEKNTVYIESAGGVRYAMFTAASEAEAYEFCNDNRWEWKDENGFVWDLDYID